jgi:lipoprotein-anchoring transpeptidase ErfK/SrfK
MDRHASASLTRLFAALLAVTALALAMAGSAAAAGASGTYTETLLSNELDTSRWAFVTHRVSAFSRPGNHGRKLRTLSTRTPDRTSELVLAIRERVYSDGTVWTEVRLPMHGSGRTGWVDRGDLDKYRVIHTRIEIDRTLLTAKLFKNEALVWSASIAVGSSAHRTPAGNFYIRDRLVTTDSKGRFGPNGLGLSAYASTDSDWPSSRSMIGIHGTNHGSSVPGHTSDPCIRLKNTDVKSLFKLAVPGTPVRIF